MLTLAREVQHPRVVYPEIKNILFATDFSHCSACTLECLRALAELHGSTIRVVHVVSPRAHEATPTEEGAAHTVHTNVPAFLEKHPITNVPYELWTAHGPVVDTLIHLARHEDIDMIALGARGHSKGTPGLGLVAGQILSAAPCPVFTSGEQKKVHKDEGLKRILYATDFSPASLQALPYAVGLAEKTGAHLMMTYVDTPEYSADWLIEAMYEGKMLNLLPRGTGLYTVEPIVAIGPVAKGIVDTAAEHDADVIVMGFPMEAPEHSSEIHAQAHCPVLSVH